MSEPRKVAPMPDRIWLEVGREMADDGSFPIEDMEVVGGPDPDADYPYQERAEYVRLAAAPPAGEPSERERAFIEAADLAWAWGMDTSGNERTVLYALAKELRLRAAPATDSGSAVRRGRYGLLYSRLPEGATPDDRRLSPPIWTPAYVGGRPEGGQG